MREAIRKFTCGHPRQMIRPVIFLTIENLFMVFPSVATLFAIQFIVSAFAGTLDFAALWMIVGILGLLFALQALVSILAHLNTFLPAAENCANNKTTFIQNLRRLPLGYFQKKLSGELINNFTGDFLAVEQSMVGMFTGIFSVVFSCLITSVFFFFYNPAMALAFYITVVFSVLMLVFSGKMSSRLTHKTAHAKDKASTYLNEYLHGIKVLKLYNQTGSSFKKLKNAYDNLVSISLKTESFVGTLANVSCSIAQLALPIVCFVGASLLLGGELGMAEYIAIIIVSTKILVPIVTYIRYMVVLRIHYVSASRIDAVLKEKPLLGKDTADPHHDLIFQNVSFAYDTNVQNAVLKDISFTVPNGKLTAVVGPSGSGKSTILRLIARFWDVTQGEITCGVTALQNTDAESWVQNISMVLQDVYMFHETVRENLLFGRDDISEEDMFIAAKKAQCHEFITRLPDGYDTVLGEGGCTLSGGEKQRLSIARALLKNTPILLLDEPTASLDAKNEALVQAALSELVKDKTVVMVAHRLKTVQEADQILVVDKGQIIESGTHMELLNTGGLYAKLWEMQTKAFAFQF